MNRPTPPPVWLIIAAFAAVYLIWGSTYLGIKLAIDSIPPLLMAGSRSFAAGAGLYAFMRWRGGEKPTAAQWKSAAITGGLLLFAGNGGVTWAEQFVPTGQTALLVAATPLWILLADWLRPNGNRPGMAMIAGLIVGFVGVSLIVTGRDDAGQRIVPMQGAIVLFIATVCWAIGSVYARHAEKPASALLGVSMQMLAGGALLILTGLATGEAALFHPSQLTATSMWAWLYLTLIGSLVGFTAYVWLLAVSTPAKVSTYAYVNPLVAVILGYLILKEPFPHSAALAAALILAAVLLITRKPGERKADSES